ncbi:uroporphyrinogen decarboxylase family protein [Eubacterium sp. F2]|jgi:MtaA/CmuA family methyltransferase|uniref:uroporphyrinogen decarboxylase family protein n=1 Tax=Eubacterium sp. F2 TaxID=3381348 RepID=UPI003907FC38
MIVQIKQYLHGLEVPKDELTALERSELYSQGKEVDRIPCSLDTGETMAPMMGMSIDKYYHSAEMMCDLEVWLQENFHSDSAGLSTTLRGMAEAMGSEISYSDNNISQLKTPAIRSLKDIDNAKLVDVDKDGRLPIILKGLQMVKDKLGKTVPISASVTGPFTIAAMVMGTEHLMIGMIKAPEKIHQLLDVIVENNNRYIKRVIDMGIGIGFCDPVSSTSLINEKQYRTFSLPYLQKNIDFIKSQGAGCGLHICGTSRKIWEDLRDTGISGFSLDNCESLLEAKKVLGDKMAIMGNVPPVDVMRYGTPQDVLRAAKACIRDAWDSPCGFTLTSGCQMPTGTPAENMTALMDAARIFGRYPIDTDLLNSED